MAYTRTWDDTQPPDSGARDQVGTFIRNVRGDIHERMNDQFVVDWTTDPLVPQARILGNVTGKRLNIHWSAFSPMASILGGSAWLNNKVSAAHSDAYTDLATADGASYNLYAPLILPNGVTVTACDFFVDPNGGSGVSVVMCRYALLTGATSNVFTPVSSATLGYTDMNPGTISEVIDTGTYGYFLKVTMNAQGSKLYSASVFYNTPDCRNTL